MKSQRRRTAVLPFLSPMVEQRWIDWRAFPLGHSGAKIVEAGMSDWSGVVPPAIEVVVHVLLPGAHPASATRDLGDGRRDTLVRPGQVCVTPAARPGDWAWRGCFRDLNLVLPKSLLARIADDAGLADVPDLMPLTRGPQEDALIEGLVRRLGSAGRGELPQSAGEIDHAIALVACWLLNRASPALKAPRGGLSAPTARRVRAHIEENLHRDLSVGELADLAGLSTPYFSHAFQATIGEAPYQYVLRRRCMRACALLETRDPLSDIALAVGFASQAHFTTAFRRFVGTTPGAWRRGRLG